MIFDYRCDWPNCEPPRRAVAFVDQGETHRPVCAMHADYVVDNELGRVVGIEQIDPKKVPRKVPTQAERERAPAPSEPPIDEVERHTQPTDTRPSRPPLREAFANLAAALLDSAKEEVERWRRR